MAKRAPRGRKINRKDLDPAADEQPSKTGAGEEHQPTVTKARRARFVTTPDGHKVVLFRCGYCGKAQTRPTVEPDRPLICHECTAPLQLADVADVPPPLPRVATPS